MIPQRGSERVYSASHGMTVREDASKDFMTALLIGGYDPPISDDPDKRRYAMALEAYKLADAWLLAGNDTAKTRVVVGPPVSLDAAAVDCNGHVTTFEPTC